MWRRLVGGADASILPVFDSGDDVFDAGADAPVLPVVVVADDAAGVVAAGAGDGGGAAVAAVTEDLVLAGEQVCGRCAGDDDVVAVTRPAAGRGVGVRR